MASFCADFGALAAEPAVLRLCAVRRLRLGAVLQLSRRRAACRRDDAGPQLGRIRPVVLRSLDRLHGAATSLVSRLTGRFGIDALIWWGIGAHHRGCLLSIVVYPSLAGLGHGTIFLPQILIGFGNGLLLPTSVAGAVSIRPQVAGTASGLTGFVQMAIGAAAAQLAGHIIAQRNRRHAAAAADAGVRDRHRRRRVLAGAALTSMAADLALKRFAQTRFREWNSRRASPRYLATSSTCARHSHADDHSDHVLFWHWSARCRPGATAGDWGYGPGGGLGLILLIIVVLALMGHI